MFISLRLGTDGGRWGGAVVLLSTRLTVGRSWVRRFRPGQSAQVASEDAERRLGIDSDISKPKFEVVSGDFFFFFAV